MFICNCKTLQFGWKPNTQSESYNGSDACSHYPDQLGEEIELYPDSSLHPLTRLESKISVISCNALHWSFMVDGLFF
jgi:hypothetical protein